MTNGESKTGMGHTAAVSLAAVSMVVAIAAVGISVTSGDDGATTGVATTGGEQARGFEPGEAQEPTIDEVSRHATELPPSADYTRYENGEYSDFVERDGPITQEVHFQIDEGVAEVLPGTTVNAWTFDGAVPGPMLRTQVGDTVDFFLHNPEDSQMPHNVDFHAVTGPGGGAVKLNTAPGDTSELKVKMLNPGIYIYHCAFPDIPTHISHGMYGLIVVEPEGGLPEVDHEYYVMQHEWYTNAGGDMGISRLEDVGHLEFSGAHGNLEEPTFVPFNGRPGALAGDRALGVFGGDAVQPGQTVRMFVGNIGPNLISSFHVIGEIFDRVYVEGSFDLVNQNVQTTLVPSGGAVGVEFTVDVGGDYILVDHAIFRAVHKGALGVLHVEGDQDPEIYDSITFSEQLGGDDGHGGDGDDADAADAEPAASGDGTVRLGAQDIAWAQDELTAAAGEVTFEMVNEGQTIHSFVIEGRESDLRLEAASNGDTDSGSLDLEPGEYGFYCDIPGHQAAGMEGTLTVS